MEFLRTWVRGVAIIAICLSFLEMLLPKNNMAKFIRMVIGLVVVASILGPIVNLLGGRLGLPDIALGEEGGFQAVTALSLERGRRLSALAVDQAHSEVKRRLEGQVVSLVRSFWDGGSIASRVELGLGGELTRVEVTLSPSGGRVTSGRASSVDSAVELRGRLAEAIADFYGIPSQRVTIKLQDR